MEQHHEAVAARIGQLQAKDLPAALQGLLRQAETALRPASKADRARRPATPAPQKRSLVAAILLLLDRAGRELDRQTAVYQALAAQLLAAFQQHAWLWERLLRVDFAEVLGAPAAAGVLAEALLQLGAHSQARAFNLVRLQLAHCLLQQATGPTAVQRAALERILSAAFARLKQCLPVVSYSLPEEAACAGLSWQPPAQQQQQQQQPRENGRVQVTLCEQLPALLHLALVLTCGWVGQSDSMAGLQSVSGSNSNGIGGGGASDASCCLPGAAPAAMGPAGQVAAHGAECGSGAAAAAAAPARGAVLRYAVLLLERLGQPDALHEALGLALGTAPAGLDSAGGWLSEVELVRVQAAQHTMEVLLDALLTLPAVAGAAAQQLQGSSLSNPGPGSTGQQQQQQHEEQQQQQGGCGAWGSLGSTVTALLALHWELSKLRAACSAEPEFRGSRAHLTHLSKEAGLQLLRVATSKAHLAGAAAQRLLALMPRAGAGHTHALPPVQLLLPPAVMAHTLDLVGRSMEDGAWQEPRGALSHGSAAAAEGPCMAQLVERLLEVNQACFQALLQPRLVLHGPLHREAILAATRLHTLLTQPPAASAEALRAAAAAAAAAAACEMGAEGALDGTQRRCRSTARKRSLACLSEVVLAGNSRPPPAKRGKAHAEPDAGPGAGAQPAPARGGTPAAGSEQGHLGDSANPVAALLQLFEEQLPGEQQQRQQPTAAEAGAVQTGGGSAPGTSAQAQQGQQQQQQQQQLSMDGASGSVAARKRVVPQQIAPEPAQQQEGRAPPKRRITAFMVQPDAGQGTSQLPLPDGPSIQASATPAASSGPAPSASHQRGSSRRRSRRTAAGSFQGGSAMTGPAAIEAAEPAEPAQQQQQQQQQGRVYLKATSQLDDAGREALWAAYIADKELLVEMLGDAHYQDWYDEAAHPLPIGATFRGVDTVLDEALGNLGEGSEVEGDAAAAADQLALPPGPATLLAASVQLPWQAALAACLQLLGRCLDRALASVRAREAAPLTLPLGDSLAAGRPGGEAAAAVAAAAELLCGVVGEAQRGAAAIAAARIMQRGSGTNTLTMARKGACSHPVGGALLHFATQLLDATQQRAGGRTAPVLLSAYTAVLARLLPLGQQEGLLQQAKAADVKKLGKPPLQLLPPVGLQLLQEPQLRPAALAPDSVACLLQLAQPCEAQEALAQHAALLWGLLQPGPLAVAAQDGRRRAGSRLSLPFWLNDAPCDLPQQRLLRPGAPAAAQAAAAEELLRLLEEGVEHWERERGLDAATHGLAAAAPDVQPALPARGGSGSEPAGSSKAAPAQKRGRGRPRKAAQAKAPPQPAPATAAHAAAGTLAGAAPVRAARPPSQQGNVSAWLGAEVLLPAIDACCTAVQWLAQPQEGPGAEPPAELAPAGPLGSSLALRRLLALCHRLVTLCTRQLQHLATCMDALPGAACPPELPQAALLWPVSLEMHSHLEQAAAISWPQALVPRQQQLEAALEELAGAHHTCAELLKALPDSHPAYPALLAAMEGAPSLFVLCAGGSSGEGALEGDGAGLGPADSGGEGEQSPHAGRGGPKQGGRGKQHAAGAAQQAQRGRRRRRRRLQDIKNPFVRAIIAEGGYNAEDLEGDDLSDLEDFIVPNPGRDYDTFLAQHFPLARDSDDDGEEEEEGEGGSGQEAGQQEAGGGQQRAGGEERAEARRGQQQLPMPPPLQQQEQEQQPQQLRQRSQPQRRRQRQQPQPQQAQAAHPTAAAGVEQGKGSASRRRRRQR